MGADSYSDIQGNPIIAGKFWRESIVPVSVSQANTVTGVGVAGGVVGFVTAAGVNQVNRCSPVTLLLTSDYNFVFTDGIASELSLAAAFPAIDGTEQSVSVTSGTLPSGVTLDPIGKRLIYDGTPGITLEGITLTGKANAPKISFSNATGTIPVMAGIVFPKGVVTGNLRASVSSLNVVVRRTWNDGSVKHAVVVGTAESTDVVTFLNDNHGGIDLTPSDIATAAPTAIVNIGSLGTASLASLLATPFETWIATPKFIECHYRWTSSVNTAIAVEFHVRLWHNGKLWVRACVENSRRIRTNGSSSYNVPLTGSVSIFGTTVYTYSATALYENTQHIHERWDGGTQYDIIVNHDRKQIVRTKLVPEYGMATSITETRLASLKQTYSINNRLDYTASWSAPGYQDQIGILPTWDVCYLISGDARAYRAVMAQGKAGFNFSILWREAGRMLTPLDYPTSNYAGISQGGSAGFVSGSLTCEDAHQPSIGYLPYILTGDALYEDAMLGMVSMNFQLLPSTASGVSRIEPWVQTRATAWRKRAIANAAAIVHDSAYELSATKSWLKSHIDFYATKTIEEPLAVDSDIGYPSVFSTYNPSLPQTVAPWMHNFWIGVMGYCSDVDPVSSSDMTKLVSLRDWMYRGIVGFLGDGLTGNFCYTYWGDYNITISNEIVANFSVRYAKDIYQSWGDVMTATHGGASCGTSYSIGGYSHYSDQGMAMPAIAYAKSHSATGIDSSYTRLTTATGWSTFVNCDWSQYPVWGLTPRTSTPTSIYSASVQIAEDPNDFGLVGNAISGMSSGSWLDYTGTNINTRVVYPDQPVQSDAPFSVMESQANYPLTQWANKWSFDRTTKQIAGIGTAQGFSSESPAGTHGKCVWFDFMDNAFYQDWNPNGLNEGHIYDGTTSRALNGFIYHRGFHSDIITKCDVSTRTWSRSGLSYSGVYAFDACGLEVFPDRGSNGTLFMVGGAAGNGYVYTWDLLTGTRTFYGSSYTVGDYPVAFYCAALESIIFGGGGTSTGKLYKFDKTGTITQITTTLPTYIGSSGSGPLIPDPSGSAKAWFISHSLNQIHSVDLNTGTWTNNGSVPSGLSGKVNFTVGISLFGLGALALFWGSGRGSNQLTYSKFWLYKV